MYKFIKIFLIELLIIHCGFGKIFKKCELAHELKYRHNIPDDLVAIYTCIAERQSNFNTEVVGDGHHFGMYQLSSEFWCSKQGVGKECNIACSDLIDDDISDDLDCIQVILGEHERLSGDGFNAWPSYRGCKQKKHSYLSDCQNENQILKTYEKPVKKKKTSVVRSGGSKVYDRCELAQELRYQHNIPLDQIATWVCIAKHESNFNTSAIGRLNWDGSEDHGLFQISDIYWCSPPGKGWACGVTCAELEDDDITDDVECIKTIHAEHQRLSGDGFNAWTVYQGRCKGKAEKYIEGCFDDENTILPFKPKPGVVQTTKYVKPTKKVAAKKTVGTGKVYDKCELARELRDVHGFSLEHTATWVCIAKHESNFNTSAIGRLNWDGSEDHGLFQISDLFWCSPPGKGWACDITCAELEDNDITDDVECIRKIYEEHQGLSGDGFNAWTVYPGRCKGTDANYVRECFDDSDNIISVKKPAVTSPPRPKSPQKSLVGKGKVYDRCELAQELRYKFKISMEQVATWVCIAQHESNFNTSAIGRLNWDGSEDHGLFQISDLYWCSPPGKGKACGLTCEELEDNDITDDVECILKIFEEHQYLFGDGFNAWTVYRPHCQGRSEKYIRGCFADSDEDTTTKVQLTTRRTTKPTTKTSTKTLKTTIKPKTTKAPIKTTTTRRTTTKPTKSSSLTTKNLFDDFFANFKIATTKPATTKTVWKTVPTTSTRTTTRTTETPKTTTNKPVVTTTKTTTTRFVSKPTVFKPVSSSAAIYDAFQNRFNNIVTTKAPLFTQKYNRDFEKTKALTTKASFTFATKAPSFNNFNNFVGNRFNNIPTQSVRTVKPSTTKRVIPAKLEADRKGIQINNIKLTPVVSNSLPSSSFNLYHFYLDFFNNKKPISKLDSSENKVRNTVVNKSGSSAQLTPHSFDYLLQLTTPRNRRF